MGDSNLGPAVALIVVGVLGGMQLQKLLWQMRPRRRRWHDQRGEVLPFQAKHDAPPIVDAADQLRTVMKAEFKPERLLNKSEARLFRAIDKMVLEMRPSWQVMAQVSLGEILRCEERRLTPASTPSASTC